RQLVEYYQKQKPTVSSHVRCKLSISSTRARTLSSNSSKPSSSTTCRAAWRMSIESGRTSWWICTITLSTMREMSETVLRENSRQWQLYLLDPVLQRDFSKILRRLKYLTNLLGSQV